MQRQVRTVLLFSAVLGSLAGVYGGPLRAATPAFVNVRDYGALCNDPGGTVRGADDTAAFQAAFNAATGGRVQVPPGKAGTCLGSTQHCDDQVTPCSNSSQCPTLLCRVTNTLALPTNVILEGASPMASKIWLQSSSGIPVVLIGSYTASSPVDTEGGGLKDIGIWGNGINVANQVGVLVTRATEAKLENVMVRNVETAFKLDGGPAGNFTGDTTLIHPMTSGVKYGLYITSSGGLVTDTRCCTWGEFYGNPQRTGEGIHADRMTTSQLCAFSVECFKYGVRLMLYSSVNLIFGGRAESIGSGNGTQSYVCDGAGVV